MWFIESCFSHLAFFTLLNGPPGEEISSSFKEINYFFHFISKLVIMLVWWFCWSSFNWHILVQSSWTGFYVSSHFILGFSPEQSPSAGPFTVTCFKKLFKKRSGSRLEPFFLGRSIFFCLPFFLYTVCPHFTACPYCWIVVTRFCLSVGLTWLNEVYKAKFQSPIRWPNTT